MKTSNLWSFFDTASVLRKKSMNPGFAIFLLINQR